MKKKGQRFDDIIRHPAEDSCQPNPHSKKPADLSESAGALGRNIIIFQSVINSAASGFVVRVQPDQFPDYEDICTLCGIFKDFLRFVCIMKAAGRKNPGKKP
jgi:hypothetical protein